MNMKPLKDKNLYYVGGVVRDEMLGIKSIDTDLCYEGNAIEYSQNTFGNNVVKTNPNFGTVRVLLDGKETDIASTREEDYPKPGHLPVVKNIGCSLLKDLKRRDFTINAMAKNTVTGEVYDPYNGKQDIENCILRVLHERSFIEDPTRIIRGLKFSVRFGFELESKTKILQDEYLSNINYDMSYFRLKKELIETFNLNKGETFDKFINQGLYKLLGAKQIVPKVNGTAIQKAVSDSNFNPWIIYMGFFNLENLPLTRYEKHILDWTNKLKSGETKGNNTPPESILIDKLFREAEC